MAVREIIGAMKKLDAALTPGSIGRLANWHFGRVKAEAGSLSKEELGRKIGRYKTLEPGATVAITGLGVVAVIGMFGLLDKSGSVSQVTLVLLAPPASALVATIGPGRGMWRLRERRIFEEELRRRGQLLESDFETGVES